MATEDNSKSFVNIDAVKANCGCGDCDFIRLISNGCPNPRRDIQFINLDTTGLSTSQILQIKADAEAIFELFSKVTHEFDIWMEKNVSIEEYRKVLTRMQGVMPWNKSATMLMDRREDIRAANHGECSTILSSYYTWFNCDILRKIVEIVKTETRSDKVKLISSLKSYKDEVSRYSKRSMFECPAPSGLARTKGTTYCVLKVSDDQFCEKKNITAEEIATFTAKLMQSFRLQEYAMKLCTVDKGCLQLVYSIPICVYSVLFPLTRYEHEALRALGIMEIITKDQHPYNIEPEEEEILKWREEREKREMKWREEWEKQKRLKRAPQPELKDEEEKWRKWKRKEPKREWLKWKEMLAKKEISLPAHDMPPRNPEKEEKWRKWMKLMEVKMNDADVAEVAIMMACWKDVGKELGIEDGEIEKIESEDETPEEAVLKRWMIKDGSEATYEKLYYALMGLNQQEVAEIVTEIAGAIRDN